MTDNPRRRLRSFIKRNKLPETPLFVPLVYAAAAQIDAVERGGFLRDPTQLSKGLSALHQALESDGVVTFSDAGTIAQALGARVEEGDYPPRILAHASEVSIHESIVSSVLGHVRLAAGLETTGRLLQTLHGDPILSVVLPGPVRLADDAYGAHSTQELEASTHILVAVCRAFGEAGTQLFVLEEAAIVDTAAWETALRPVINVIRFYQGLPVLAGNPQTAAPAGALPCVTAGADSDAACARLLSRIPAQWGQSNLPCVLLITDGEIVADVDIGALRSGCVSVQYAG